MTVHLLVGQAGDQQKIACGVDAADNHWTTISRDVTCLDCKAIETGHRKRFVIVFYEADFDYYALAFANQGRYHFDDKKKALETFQVFEGKFKGWDEMKLIEAECYGHGDCCRTIFTPEYVEEHEVKP